MVTPYTAKELELRGLDPTIFRPAARHSTFAPKHCACRNFVSFIYHKLGYYNRLRYVFKNINMG